MEFTLLGAALVAMISLYVAIRWDAVRANAADCVRDHWDRAVAATVTGVFAGRVIAMLLDGVNPVSGEILIVRAGVNPVAATIAAVATVAWLGRTELELTLDGLAAAALVGLAGWHGSCVVRDSCLGTMSDLPWAFAGSAGGPARHPVELYAAVLLLAAGFALSVVRTGHRLAAFVASFAALGAAGLVRLVTEPMRLSLSGGPVRWYLAAAIVGTAGAFLLQMRVSAGVSDAAGG